jgi:uncharacterized protein YkwD
MLSLVFACLAITAIAVPTSSPFAPSSDAGEGVEKAAVALLSDWSSDAHEKWAKADNSSHHHNGSHPFPKANCSDATSMYATSTLNASHARSVVISLGVINSIPIPIAFSFMTSSPPLPTSSTTPPMHTVASQPHSSSSTHTHHSTEPSPVHSTVNGTATPTHPAVENPGGSTPTQPITSSSTPRNTASPTPSLSASAAAYLDPHNTLRAKHSAKALVWSDALAKAAQDWADRCQWAHSDGAVGNYGENIAAGTGTFAAADAVAAWASEECMQCLSPVLREAVVNAHLVCDSSIQRLQSCVLSLHTDGMEVNHSVGLCVSKLLWSHQPRRELVSPNESLNF